ncbi:GntR family transcriptional regulator [Paenibacillus aurantius]|uniref:GntR family transcriptional regulator n=1 Tax=Paenibacillus aurantius TaxID=2918900 RepID=A0AA96LIL6_9BACL|nr:GntR family transcriptional regulator [Paenibacillus aurantius]WNQ13958.1 GntR family transcriptional regulator [Paenibacillus aurantius]
MRTPSLRHHAYQSIHQWIVSGQLPKGTSTSEGALSSMLDMSRTPVRAALQQLEQEGYVRIAPKHGVIILDSSSQRVSDLLEILISLVLFSVHAAWELKHQELLEYSSKQLQSFRVLLNLDTVDADSLVIFEYGYMLGLIRIGRNEEMSVQFQNTASRVFWSANNKRWKAPYQAETTHAIGQLLMAIPIGLGAFRESLFLYLQIIKRTWL